MGELRALGLISGIGSLLVGARDAGFKVVGNIEDRKYYHARDAQGRNTFTENFPGAFMVQRWDDLTPTQIDAAMEVDLVCSHADCGAFSVMNGANLKGRTPEEAAAVATEHITLLISLLQRVRPRFFVADNLPMSLIAVPISAWAEALPGYDLFPEWISNYNYGNVQKNRKRLFMIGAKHEEGFVFIPNETENTTTLADVIGNIPPGTPNHEPHNLTGSSGRCPGRVPGRYLTWSEMRDLMMTLKEGESATYLARDGTWKPHIGLLKTHRSYCHTITGGNPIYSPWTCLPFSIRERARIQGFPDDFVFYGTKLEPDGSWQHLKNFDMVKQTGKAMPIQFARYIARWIRGQPSMAVSGRRLLHPNRYITRAKRDACVVAPYANMDAACAHCWVTDCNRRIK